jgi:hypothetical protein
MEIGADPIRDEQDELRKWFLENHTPAECHRLAILFEQSLAEACPAVHASLMLSEKLLPPGDPEKTPRPEGSSMGAAAAGAE